MKSIDRIKSTIRFEETDRVPVFSHIFGFSSRIKRIPLKDYLNSGELLALCQLEAWKRFGYDGVTAFADNSLEAEAIGAKISYNDNDEYQREPSRDDPNIGIICSCIKAGAPCRSGSLLANLSNPLSLSFVPNHL